MIAKVLPYMTILGPHIHNTDKIIFFDSEQLMICVQGSPDAKAKRKKGKGLEYKYVEGIMVGKSKS